MCHERWFRREQREERFDEELRFLMDRERERREPPAPVVEHQPDTDPVAERAPDEVPVAGSS
jgi:hypothetical protein